MVGCTPAAWHGRVHRGTAPPSVGYCPRRGVRVWDASAVFTYRDRGRHAGTQARYAGRWVNGVPVVEMLAWCDPGPASGPGFHPTAWRGERRS